MSDAIFFSTQFVPVEEQEKFRSILQSGGFDFTGSEEGPLLDIILAGGSQGDVVGALHGTFPPLEEADAMQNMIDIADDLSATRDFAQAFLETGLLGTQDFLYYVPWMQATYIMAANKQALDYLPAGADINALTWEQLGTWCQNLLDQTGKQLCGVPHAGLFHRFLEGYLWPSYTGGMVTEFKSSEAASMLTWVRDSLWPTINPGSINYEFMQEPLLAGDVWVALVDTAGTRVKVFEGNDNTLDLIVGKFAFKQPRQMNTYVRLNGENEVYETEGFLDMAFNQKPDDFVAFPAPAGPAGRGFMPVVVGLGIPSDAPHPDAAKDLIDFLTRPDVQGAVLKDLGFFPVVSGVDFSGLPAGVAIEANAVTAQSGSTDALPALLPVGLGERGGEINQIFRNAFDRVVLNGENIQTVLDEEAANLQALMNETGAPCWAPDPASTGPCQVK